MKQDKYGIYLPDNTKIPAGNDRKENTTRIYTTKNEAPMSKSEVLQCIAMYKKEIGFPATTMILPTNLKEHAIEIEKETGLIVKLGAARPYQITLSQLNNII